MKSKINIVKRDLRLLKKNSHAVKRIIEIQGLHFKRISALEKMEKSEENKVIIKREKEIIQRLRLKEVMAESAEIERKYLSALDTLHPRDKAMVLDCFVVGMPYWKLGAEYGYSEEGVRKHINALIRELASKV